VSVISPTGSGFTVIDTITITAGVGSFPQTIAVAP
jgi:hypothetical protein